MQTLEPFDTHTLRAKLPALLLTISLLSIASVLCTLYPDTYIYQREILAAGEELWRAITGHFVHLDTMHATINILTMIILVTVLAPFITMGSVVLYLLVSCVLVSLALYLWSPEVSYYAGLSGVLHSLFVLSGLRFIGAGHTFIGITMLTIFAGKAIAELVTGESVTTSMDVPVVLEAHIYGIAVGLILCLPYVFGLIRRLWTNPRASQ